MEFAKLLKNPIARTVVLAVILLVVHLGVDKLSELTEVSYEMIYFTTIALILLYVSVKDPRFEHDLDAVQGLGAMMWFAIRVPGWCVLIGFIMAIPVILAPNYLGLIAAFAIYAFAFKHLEVRLLRRKS